MRLTRVALTDFMCYRDLDLDLSGIDNLVVGGENGAGKSALLDAVTWALFDRSRLPGGGEGSSPDKLVRLGATTARVRVEWQAGGRTYQVAREHAMGSGGALSLTIDGQRQTAHTTKETRERVRRELGIGYEALLAGPIMVQSEQYTAPTGLMQAAPAARKEILMAAVADASLWGPLHEQASGRWAEHDTLRRSAEARAVELEETVRRAGELGPHIEAAQRKVDEAEAEAERLREEHAAARETLGTMAAQAGQHAAASARVDSLTLLLRDDQGALERQTERIANSRSWLAGAAEIPPAPEPSLREAASRRVDAALEASRTAAQARGTRDTLRSQLDRAEAAVARRDETIKGVPCHGEGIYATCPFLRAPAEDTTVADLHTAWQLADAEVREAGDRAEDLTPAQRAHDELELGARRAEQAVERRAQAERVVAEAGEESDRLVAKIGRETDELLAAAKERDTYAAAAEARFEAERAATRLLLAAQRAKEDVARARGPLEALQREAGALERAKAELEAWRRRMAEAVGEADTYRTLAGAFHRDGIPTLIIETAVPIIERHANEVLDRLPGGLRIAMAAGGGASERLSIAVSGPAGELDYYMLSIGQRFRVDFALRIAQSRLYAERGGAKVETLWLDEPLAHVDARGREAVVDALGAVEDEFGLIVVVSHHDEFDEAFGHRLLVAQEAGASTAALQ